ncbi:MAG: mucoidy inhibitor MuiA family protein [Chloroflexi bacterium]|nr:mucoidy inhibitor MuiA family protein [Chloroflexota bacterium]MCI0577321.1 mucoidy inhibitor MuiA family protein [Chloroflexota bacterium]MCI0646822.1 mucoidy inhibitor MuiA family protein [Chloroflexota bacterium]MCI0728124.1 mucoidy inhibitor MuiA family protein [Chloroflexota bacterium]
MEIPVETSVAAVTVYPDRARVTCRGQAQLATGLQRLIVDNLPLTLQPDSVRVGGRGTAQVRILGVDVNRAFYEQTPAEKVRELEQQIERLEDELRVLTDRQAAQAAHAKYLEGLRQATQEYARGLARGRTTVEEQTRLVQFIQEQDDQVRTTVRELEQQQREINRRLDKLRRELKTLQSARPTQRFRAFVELEALGEGTFGLEVSYVVHNAGWQPLYDLRLLETENGRTLEVTTIAQVVQNSGQDWLGVALTVSTARPALSQRLPELYPWYLDVYAPPPVPQPARRRASGEMAAGTMLAATPAMAEEAAAEAAPKVAEAQVAQATVQESGTAVTFVVAGQTDIPSDGSPHKTTIHRFDLEPQLDYLVVPKHTDAVFRRVTVSNSGPGPLLAGQASLFVGEEFIGSTHLEYSPAGQEMKLLLGAEERITVERELVRRDVDKALLRDKRQLRYGYEIELHNLLASEVNLEVHDHIPVARHEEIKVKLERVAPPPTKQSELNLMEWRLTLPPGAKQTINYEFLVEHPRSLRVTGLID